MSKQKGSHGIYDLTCISYKCRRRFKVIYDVRTIGFEMMGDWSEKAGAYIGKKTTRYVVLTYPFTGCPFCGAWWCTGPLDGEAYPKPKVGLFTCFLDKVLGPGDPPCVLRKLHRATVPR